MTRFTDALGREWTLAITVQEIRSLRETLEVDLLEMVAENSRLLQRLATDPILLVDVIGALCIEQIDERKLTPREFAAGLVGEGLDAATNALIGEVANFFGPQKGAYLRSVWQKMTTAVDAAYQRASERIGTANLDQAARAKVDRAIDEALAQFGV